MSEDVVLFGSNRGTTKGRGVNTRELREARARAIRTERMAATERAQREARLMRLRSTRPMKTKGKGKMNTPESEAYDSVIAAWHDNTSEQLIIGTLEALVDRISVKGVLEGLAVVAANKAEHLRTNWQDENSAKVWDAACKRLQVSAKHAADDGV